MLGMIIGTIRRIFSELSVNRQLRNIERQNDDNKNVVEYYDAPVEAYISKEKIENIVASGNNEDIRDRISCAATYNAYKLGYPVIVLHCGNEQLEKLLRNAFSQERGLHIINRKNKLYDPFVGLDKDQITQLVLSSVTEDCKIQHNGGAYIMGLTGFLIANECTPCASSYIRCPHRDLWNRIENRIRQGDIPQGVANEIKDQIEKGESERGNVEHYFGVLNRQAECVLADRDTVEDGNAISIRRAINNNEVISIDVVSSASNLLLNVLVQEMKDAITQGKRFAFVLDSIPVNSSKSLENLLENFSNRCTFVYSSRDAYSDTSCTETLFDTLLGRANSVFVMQHNSASASERFSKYFGKYQKNEVNNTITRGDNYATYDQVLPGSSTSRVHTTHNVESNRVEEREITGLASNKLFIKKERRSEIILVRCTDGNAVETYSEPRRKSPVGATPSSPSSSRSRFNWGIFILLFVVFYPAAFVYGFVTSGRRGKIAFGIIFLVLVAGMITITALDYSGVI